MKKITIIMLAVCLGFLTTYGQENRGLDNRFYFRVGYSNPANSFAGWSQSAYLDYLSKVGGVFEIGSIFMLNNLELADGLRIGINADYAEVVYHQFDFDDGFETIVLRMAQVSSKVGPNISYSPVSRLVFDGFIKAKVSWIAGGYFTADDPLLDEEVYSGAMGFGFSTGLNVRYGVLMVGFDYSSNNIKMNNKDDSDDYLGNFFDENDSGDKTKMAYFNFTIGLNF